MGWPVASTFGNILQRAGLTSPKRKKRRTTPYSEPFSEVFISEVFRFEILGFEQVDEDFYKVYFRDVEIGEFDAEALRFRPVQFRR